MLPDCTAWSSHTAGDIQRTVLSVNSVLQTHSGRNDSRRSVSMTFKFSGPLIHNSRTRARMQARLYYWVWKLKTATTAAAGRGWGQQARLICILIPPLVGPTFLASHSSAPSILLSISFRSFDPKNGSLIMQFSEAFFPKRGGEEMFKKGPNLVISDLHPSFPILPVSAWSDSGEHRGSWPQLWCWVLQKNNCEQMTFV